MAAVTVLLEVTCRVCETTHDVWGSELPGHVYDIDADDLRCPACDVTAPAKIAPREPLV